MTPLPITQIFPIFFIDKRSQNFEDLKNLLLLFKEPNLVNFGHHHSEGIL